MSSAFSLDEALEVLSGTPDVLDALLSGLADGWTTADEGADTWSPFDVVGHLVHGEETDWIARARIILNGGPDPVFVPFDRFAQADRFQDACLTDLLAMFRELRVGNLETLDGWEITDEQLDLPGRHPELGPVTLRQLIATWAVHDLSHVAQITRVMAKRYTADVGPWREYLPILDR
jgi:hypothetical protein